VTVINTSDVVVPHWALGFALPAGTHARGEGTEFDITADRHALGDRAGVFQVECLGDSYVCASTADLAPGAQFVIGVTVHCPGGDARSVRPTGLTLFS
jgi:hypothetical protein